MTSTTKGRTTNGNVVHLRKPKITATLTEARAIMKAEWEHMVLAFMDLVDDEDSEALEVLKRYRDRQQPD